MRVSDAAIVAVEAQALQIPTDAPEADGTLEWDSTTMVVVETRAAGRSGVGWTYCSAAAAAVVAERLRPAVLGCDALDVPGAWAAMARGIRNDGRPGVVACAMSAVETSLWDLKARLLDVSLTGLLGRCRNEVPVYGSGGFTTYDDDRLHSQLCGWVDQGIGRVKIKIGESDGSREARDVARMRAARSAVGDRVELFVDANGAYTAAQAIRVMRRVEDLDVRWLEEPVSSDDLAGLRLVREAVDADVTAGEYGYDLVYFERMCAAEAVDCLQIDVSRCGGIMEFGRAAAVAAAHGLDVSGHCAPHLHLAVAAATPNLRHVEWFHDHVRIESMLFEGTSDPAGGAIAATDSPGHGLALRAEVAEGFRVA